MAYVLRCACGGEYRMRKGSYGPFWGCSGYPQCRGILRPKQYESLRNAGTVTYTPIAQPASTKPKADPDRAGRVPRTRVNTSGRMSMSVVRLTDEQRDARNYILENRFLIVDADAGTGKTSLLKAIGNEFEDSPFNPAMLVIAFNSRPIKQLNAELPSWMVASTIHGIGSDSVIAAYGSTFNKPKSRNILEATYGKLSDLQGPERVIQRTIYNQVRDLVAMCKLMVFDEYTPDQRIIDAALQYNKTFPNPEQQSTGRTLDMVREVLAIAHSQRGINTYGHDYDDMLWLPLVNKLPVAKYQFVAVDELQDLALARILLAIEIVADGGTLMGVGDWRQSIYRFALADTTAIATFKAEVEKRFNTVVEQLPLTVNWRCPTDVLDIARVLKPSIKARPGAPKGNIHAIQPSSLPEVVRVGDVCISRTNAPLVRAAYSLMRNRIPAKVLGNDYAAEIAGLLYDTCHDGKAGFCSTVEAVDRLNEWYENQEDKLNSMNLRNPQAAVNEVDDKYYCCLAALRARIKDGHLLGCDTPSVEQAIIEIKALFIDEETEDPNAACVLFSTVHKFKGGQAARIFILEGGLNYPLPFIKTDAEREEEDNVLYVAVTRAGDGSDSSGQALIFVNGIPPTISAQVHAKLTPLVVNGTEYLNSEIEETK